MNDTAGPAAYELPRWHQFLFRHRPEIEVVLVDVRERELTIKGQET